MTLPFGSAQRAETVKDRIALAGKGAETWGHPCLTAGRQNVQTGTSLVVQWLRIHLPMQGTWVRALVQKDPTCCRATKPVRHNY